MEKLTLAQYRANEEINAHSENALALARDYGTPDELNEVEKLCKSIKRKGYATMDETRRRFELTNKYYQLLNS